MCVRARVHLWMYLAGSSAELIELFFLNSWELLGRGQMPLGTRCVFSVRLCVRVCVSLRAPCALAPREHVFPRRQWRWPEFVRVRAKGGKPALLCT